MLLRRFFFIVFLFSLSLVAKDTYTIGILSFRPEQVTQKKWEPLKNYLNEKLSSYQFEIRPLSFVEISEAVANKEVDFVLTNPASYIFFKEKNLVNIPFATLLDFKNDKAMQEFGGVLFSRIDTANIQTLKDIKGKKIATVGTDSLGGYQMQAYELFEIGIDTLRDTELMFTEMPHDNTVYEVLNKKADVGFVRTSVLEQMVQEKKINLKDLRIINPQTQESFPFLLSTKLYPQWPIASLAHINNSITKELSVALLSMPDMKDFGLGGFSVAMDYTGVKNVLQKMHFPPFDTKKTYDFNALMQEYLFWLIFLGFVLFTIMSFVLYKLFKNSKQLKTQYEQLQVFEKIFQNVKEAIVITSPSTDILDVNPAFSETTGYSKKEAIGKKTNLLKSDKHDEQFYLSMWQHLKHEGFWQGEIFNRKKNGEVYDEYLFIDAVKNSSGVIEKYIAIFSDITKIKKHEKQLKEIAYFDPLTHLPNRRMLIERLESLMTHSTSTQVPFALFYIDMDGFKTINDKYGHSFGDQFLRAFTHRMQNIFQKSDFIARIGGDEFVTILPSFYEKELCIHILERLLHVSAQSLQIDSQNVSVSVSIGVSFYPQEGLLSPEKLLRQADRAMYKAKVSGKNRFSFFDISQDLTLRVRNEDILIIEHAIKSKQFVVYYQPKVNMNSGALLGFEALIRWQHPKEGLLSPIRFLPLIENHPLMMELGEFVIEEVLKQIASWKEMWDKELDVSINLSAYQILREDFVPNLKTILSRYPQVNPRLLEFEVLETSALEDITVASNVISACKELGISFSLDDFGTGYSSLTYLKRLDIQTLKIDQSFVRELLMHPDNLMILDAIIALAKSFGINVIAEGVETLTQGSILLRLGCKSAQGYFIAKPMHPQDIESWHETWRVPHEWTKAKKIKHGNISVLHSLIKHFVWMDQIIAYIKGIDASQPPLDHNSCAFANTLKQNPFLMDVLKGILPEHESLHALAKELVAFTELGQKSEAIAGITELLKCSKAMEENIYEILVKTNSQ